MILPLSTCTAPLGRVKFDAISTRTDSWVRLITSCAPSAPLGNRTQSRAPVRARRPGREAWDGRAPEQELLVPELVVVREGSLTGLELVQARSELLAREPHSPP